MLSFKQHHVLYYTVPSINQALPLKMIKEVQVYLLCLRFNRRPVRLERCTNKILLQRLFSAAGAAQRLGSNVVSLVTGRKTKKNRT